MNSTESKLQKPLILTVRDKTPKIDESCFIAQNATLISDVVIGPESSVWYNVVLRGDVAPIVIGRQANIQDGTVVHGTFNKHSTTIGDLVTIGHQCMLHGCTIERKCLIGMGTLVMDGAHISEESIVGAGSLVTEGSKFPPRSLILGRPARVKRPLTDEEIAFLQKSADNYKMYSSWYK